VAAGNLVVVKLGGSCAGWPPLLRSWLRAVQAAAGRVVLVPGGGPFADTVRDTQAAMGFGDEAADAMAMLGMAQFGIALCGLGGARFAVAESVGEIGAAVAGGRVPVWAPLAMARGGEAAAGLPRSWEVTSDSLALWLAWRLGAAAVVLVKRRGVGVARTPGTPGGGGVLVDARIGAPIAQARWDPVSGHDELPGLVDAYFSRMHAVYPCPVYVAGPGDLPGAGLDPERLPGVRVAGG
jgi:5-(aminomethyl)-3-furanmethanol phosphate kinase